MTASSADSGAFRHIENSLRAAFFLSDARPFEGAGMLHDVQAEYERLREELTRLQRERARLDAQTPPNPEEERTYARQLPAFHKEVVTYLARLERVQSGDPDPTA